jgi:hypothetical protein
VPRPHLCRRLCQAVHSAHHVVKQALLLRVQGRLRKGPARAAARGDGGGVHHRDAGHPLHIVHHAAAPHVNVAEELRQGGSEGGCAEGNDDSGGKSDKLDKLEAHASRGLGL